MEKGFILSLIFAAIVAIFALSNADKVLIDFLFIKLEISQAIVIFISTLLGAVIAALLGFFRTIKFKREIREFKKEREPILEEMEGLKDLIRAREEEIESLNEEILKLQDQEEAHHHPYEKSDDLIEDPNKTEN